MKRGKYIVIEGHDGTGKSTQVDMLAEYLSATHGISSFIAHEPFGTPVANAIRDVIKNGELERSPETNLLLFTASRHEIWQQAKKELEKGCWVISARNYLSTIAYQGCGEGLSKDLILSTTQTFTDQQYMHPDLTIILTVSEDARRSRIAQRGILKTQDTFESKSQTFQERVNQAYLSLARERNHAIIDASATPEEILTEVVERCNDAQLFSQFAIASIDTCKL